MRRWLVLLFVVMLAACERERDVVLPSTPVRTEMAKRAAFTPAVTLLGVIRAAQSIPLVPQQRGTIRYAQRFGDGLVTGARVARGEVIAFVTNDDLNAAQTEARLEMDAAAADFERAERSFQLGVISSAEHAERRLRATIAKQRYEAAVKRAGTLRVVAPASGTLVVNHVYPAGSLVDGASALAEIATAGEPIVECSVAASQRASLEPGLPVTVAARGTPAWSGSGRIAEVASVVSDSGTSRVVVAIQGGSSAVPPPGTGVEVMVQLQPRAAAVTVPEDAIVAGGEGPAVFVAATAEGASNRFRVKRVPVVVGGRANGRVEVTSGLQDGERVVVSGADALTDDALAVEVSDKTS